MEISPEEIFFSKISLPISCSELRIFLLISIIKEDLLKNTIKNI